MIGTAGVRDWLLGLLPEVALGRSYWSYFAEHDRLGRNTFDQETITQVEYGALADM